METARLSEIEGSPFPVLAGPPGPSGLAVDATGQFLYLTHGGLSGFRIDAETGALSKLEGSPFLDTGGTRGVTTATRCPMP